MKHLLLLSCLVAVPCVAQDGAEGLPELPEYRVYGEPASPEDAEAVAAVMRQLGEGWGSGDPEAVAAVYADDAEWTNAFGDVVRGADELRDFLGWMFSQDSDTTSAAEAMSYQPLSLRYVGDDAAIVHGVTRSTRAGARSGEGERRVHNTYVLAKEKGRWRIVHHMIMDVRR